MKPELYWWPQKVGEARVIRPLPRRSADWVRCQPEGEKCSTINKAGRSWRSAECLHMVHRDAEVVVCPAGFPLSLVWHFLTVLQFLSFAMAMYVHPVPLYVRSMWSAFWFILQGTEFFSVKKLPCVCLRRDWTFKQGWDCNRLRGLLKLGYVFALSYVYKPKGMKVCMRETGPSALLTHRECICKKGLQGLRSVALREPKPGPGRAPRSLSDQDVAHSQLCVCHAPRYNNNRLTLWNLK